MTRKMASQLESDNTFVPGWSAARAQYLKGLIKAFSSQAHVANAAEISRQSLVQIVRFNEITGEGSRPRVSTLNAILEVLNVDIDDFMRRADEGGDTSTHEVAEDLVDVAEIDLRFGLGGTFMDEEIVEGAIVTRSFPRSWLRQVSKSNPDDLYWAVGQGNSMEPMIGDGDIMLIDRSQCTPGHGDLVWAIAYGQTGMVKRLRPMADGSVKILSDNPSVPPEIAYDGELSVFGRVVAIVKKV